MLLTCMTKLFILPLLFTAACALDAPGAGGTAADRDSGVVDRGGSASARRANARIDVRYEGCNATPP